jgi:hypothetical protein
MKNSLISQYDIISLVDGLQDRLVVSCEGGDVARTEEITENLFAIITSCPSEMKDTAAYPNINAKLQAISEAKPKSLPGLNNKVVFKHMDILDALAKA